MCDSSPGHMTLSFFFLLLLYPLKWRLPFKNMYKLICQVLHSEKPSWDDILLSLVFGEQLVIATKFKLNFFFFCILLFVLTIFVLVLKFIEIFLIIISVAQPYILYLNSLQVKSNICVSFSLTFCRFPACIEMQPATPDSAMHKL